jgi:hypothetical protein
VSRLRQVLAAATLAVAATGGALLASAAGRPAFAATTADPAVPVGGHTIQFAATRGGGIGSRDIAADDWVIFLGGPGAWWPKLSPWLDSRSVAEGLGREP